VAVLGRGLDDLRQTAVDLVTAGASAALMIPCDVTNPDQVARATARIEEELGPIDVWIDADENNDEAAARRRALRIGVVAGAVAIAALGIVLIARYARPTRSRWRLHRRRPLF